MVRLLELLGQPGEPAGGGSHGSFFTQGSRDEQKSVRHHSRASVPGCSPDLVRARLGTSVGAAFLLPSAYEGAWMRVHASSLIFSESPLLRSCSQMNSHSDLLRVRVPHGHRRGGVTHSIIEEKKSYIYFGFSIMPQAKTCTLNPAS